MESGYRRYNLLYWYDRGTKLRDNSIYKHGLVIKLINRNCKRGYKHKALACVRKAFKMIHIFIYQYGNDTLSAAYWRIADFFHLSLFNFFFWNKFMFTKKVKIEKHLKNKYVDHSLHGKKSIFEVLKWFWLLTFSQSFSKVYQRFAFLLLEFIFFTESNAFGQLIKKVRPGVSSAKKNLKKRFLGVKSRKIKFAGAII